MKITIVGLGLIGGSLGLALRAADQNYHITGWDRDANAVAAAYTCGALTHASDSLVAAISDADLVIVATPVLAVRSVLEAIAPQLKPGTIVTDVASTKVHVLEWAAQLLPAHVTFIGGHPMAGSEQHRITSARADLLQNAVYCLVPAPNTPPAALTMLEQMVRRIGARPLHITASDHDDYVAAVSHVPFVLSAALVQQTAADPRWLDMRRLAATGYRDLTRLASGDVVMHRDICLTNATAIGSQLRALAQQLDQLATQLNDSEALQHFFATAQQHRDTWLREREEQ